MADGDCYKAAFDEATGASEGHQDSGLLLCHGTPLGTGGDAEGLRYGHAWVEDPERDVVIEKSNGNDSIIPRDLYYEVGSIDADEVTRYSYEEALENAVRSGHYGPWEENL
jgi:hypothetical protein